MIELLVGLGMVLWLVVLSWALLPVITSAELPFWLGFAVLLLACVGMAWFSFFLDGVV